MGGQLVAGLELIADPCSPIAGEKHVNAGIQAECGATDVDAAHVPGSQGSADVGLGIHAAHILRRGHRQGRGDGGAAVRLVGAGDGQRSGRKVRFPRSP